MKREYKLLKHFEWPLKEIPFFLCKREGKIKKTKFNRKFSELLKKKIFKLAQALDASFMV